ncbi:SRA stem-loop-interacting RNA-binding protein, mitochondrial [Saimiri boliviensis]|uniref:SRA stem-loop-interacting RNA-binding protein, mitochondrial n=1 Tax=Saimiri boliviensis TaxID=27679 RepID=UPI000533FA90|nr:SRA stem-loop-interacting RNA-binding protein, mitochondrial [Saimiri boliviensis boliviensis]
MAALAASGPVALRRTASRSVAFVRKIPWTAASSQLREHFAQFGRIKRCILPFDKETGFHRGMGWVQFSSEEELQNALQQESHIIDGVKLQVQAQRPKILQIPDEEKDF